MTAKATVEQAAKRIRAGDLVAFPTETVYGLGADASNDAAVAKIFAAKGRPADHPLILHVADAAQARIHTQWDPRADLLLDLWPGPLTLVLEHRDVPSAVRGGHATVAVRAATRSVVRVADAVTGQGTVNPRRMTLSTYVLRERFDAVVAAASRRLEVMSSGRFVLERDEVVSGGKKAGLGLAVLDQWTSTRRDTRTLSGGESFYASLALALGLADTVRDEVGGVELETLFVDEGFGTLDVDTLESVLDVIDALRDGGRVVGIVSHLGDLKDRIPDRIEVRRLPDGSSSVAVRA